MSANHDPTARFNRSLVVRRGHHAQGGVYNEKLAEVAMLHI